MKFDEFKPKAIAFLANRPAAKACEIAQATEANLPSTYNWLKKLVISGDITKGGGVYRLVTNEELSEAFIETAITESEAKPVECEVIEMRMPRSAMTVEKVAVKDGHIVPKTGSTGNGSTSSALSLSPKELKKEARLERTWEKLLTQPNKSQDFKTQYSSKISSNWAQVVKLHSIEDATFLRLKELTGLLIEQCGKQKWFKQIPCDEQLNFESDCESFVADALWDVKRQSGKFCDPRYHEKAYARHVMREARGSCHESIGHGTKKVKEAAQKVSELADTLKEKADSCSIDELKESIEKLSSLVEGLSLLILSGIEDIKDHLDQKFIEANPPAGLQGIKTGKLLQFPEAK